MAIDSNTKSRLANLNGKRHGGWKKGQSGNPAGRPRLIGTIAEIIRSHLQQPLDDGTTRIRLEEATERLYKEDLKTYLAYGFGKPVETQVQIAPDEQERELAKAVAREWANDPANVVKLDDQKAA